MCEKIVPAVAWSLGVITQVLDQKENDVQLEESQHVQNEQKALSLVQDPCCSQNANPWFDKHVHITWYTACLATTIRLAVIDCFSFTQGQWQVLVADIF